MTSPREVSVLKMERHKHRSRMVDDFCLIAKSIVIRNQSIMAFTVRQACRRLGPGDGWGQYRPPGKAVYHVLRGLIQSPGARIGAFFRTRCVPQQGQLRLRGSINH